MTRTKEERAGYDLALANSYREPAFARAIMIQLAILLSMSFSMIIGMPGGVGWVLVPVCGLVVLALPTVMRMSAYSQHGKARWLSEVTPVHNSHEIYAGGVKALLLRVWAPAWFLAGLGSTLVLGFRAAPAVLLAMALSATLGLFFLSRIRGYLPFTRTLHSQRDLGLLNFRDLALVLAMACSLLVSSVVLYLLTRHPAMHGAGLVVLALLIRRQVLGLGDLRHAEYERLSAR